MDYLRSGEGGKKDLGGGEGGGGGGGGKFGLFIHGTFLY